MISCPSCNNKELSGALFCSNCGAQLIQSVEENRFNDQSVSVEDFSDPVVPPVPAYLENLPDCKVALLIIDEDEIIHIEGDGEFAIGRSTQGQTILPDVDISIFQAYESGVSRLHANIDIGDSQVTIKDLGSANGTRLNGRRLDPHKELPLKNGDILTLGRLKIQVLLKV